MQETLSEIDAEQRARRERAQRFESLQNARITLRATIARLETETINVDALAQIVALCDLVPRNLTTRGQRFVSGGFEVRDMLRNIADDALTVARRKDDERNAELRLAQSKLAETEAALAEF
jgi:hypothetical protein